MTRLAIFDILLAALILAEPVQAATGPVSSTPAASTARTQPAQRDLAPSSEAAPPDPKPAPLRKGEPIHDRAAFRYMEQQGGKLLETGRLATNLWSQTNRKRCRLALVEEKAFRLAPADIVPRVEDGVMVVGRFYLCSKCSKTHLATASGFIISASGAMATSLHVLGQGQCRGMIAMDRGGRIFPVREVLAADRINDSVIVQLEGSNFVPLPLSTRGPVGSPVVVLSHPSSHFYTISSGIVSRYLVQSRRNGLASYVAITASFGAGSSGGPVFNEQGAVLGMVNNTEAIYADHAGEEHKDFQISIFNCTTAKTLLEMVELPRSVPGRTPPVSGRSR